MNHPSPQAAPGASTTPTGQPDARSSRSSRSSRSTRLARPRLATGACLGLALATTGLATTGLTSTSLVSPAAADDAAVQVDLGTVTGDFRGGASGGLYALGDDGVPSQALVDGARLTNVSQKAPGGQQHPNGDALDVEDSFFAGAGEDMYVYIQDDYPDWPYNGGVRPGDADGDGEWDYLAVVRKVAEKVATQSADPSAYVFIPFNEPDGQWYQDWSSMKDQFMADWTAVDEVIQEVYAEHGLGHARLGGPGDSVWHEDRTRDFLTYAAAHDELPDVFIFHVLQDWSLDQFRDHMATYRSILADLGAPEIPVNVTEYGLPDDMGVPGFLLQWMSVFEDEKVDAQTAYWNYAGNLDDNSSRVNGANGGWWLMKWYGDLAGGQTVQVTPPVLNRLRSLQAIATVDEDDEKATVLVGGSTTDIPLELTGTDAAGLGSTVHVQVRAVTLNGKEGDSPAPAVVMSKDVAVSGGALSLTIPNDDETTAYQVILTPTLADPAPVSTSLVDSTEAEDATIAGATVYSHDSHDAWTLPASGGKDVGSFNNAASSATWDVDVPSTGRYRLSVLAGANQAPGEHALFVDGAYAATVHYAADLGWTYRGTTDVALDLTAGEHTLSLRASRNGSSVLPGADITLDRFDLYDETGGERTTYPSTDARLTDGATLSYASASTAGFAALSGGGTATFFTSNADTGYHDLLVHYRTSRATDLHVTVNGRTVADLTPKGAGSWTTRVRVYLGEGVQEVAVSSDRGVLLDDVETVRGADQRASDSDASLRWSGQAEDLDLAGTAGVRTLAASSGSNGSADASGVVSYVGDLGNGSGNTATLERPAGLGKGAYVLTMGYANAERSSGINYNPQVVSRFLDVAEDGGGTTRVPFRHNYSWSSFWDVSVPLDLTTATGALVLGNASAYGPDLDTVALSRLVAGAPVTTVVRGNSAG
ncbi:CBM35 domain-containing protein [Nocardioides sp. GY 10127]|uniref:CBM35 domain-containing protein n=1 Tax=Nocardioides sp. GY 10127 TaxID=2569762 RepID=UPI0010A8C911|nr:CBM35 domain-containing protein [Nocardioides sp. GY 10127]TIC79108.1 carbohydrate-binding protein [Nocardioides sp. GY 10127]